MNKLKYVRIQREDGSYGDKIPFYVDGATVEINGQSLTTKINEIDSSLQNKVVKQAGKSLSANNYTNEEKQKLNGIEAGATNTEIDSTLSVEGAAADAKATGDALAGLENLSFTHIGDEAPSNEKVEIWVDTDEQPDLVIDETMLTNGAVTSAKLASGVVTEPKLTDALKLKVIKDYVTPEMFGAVGDGVTDDSAAIQSAINSGKKVIFTRSAYRTSTIYIGDCNIDCNGAEFIVKTGSNYLFYGTGSINNEAASVEVVQGQNIDLGNTYTGVGVIYSDDNLIQTREYFKSGFICEFLQGKSLKPSLFAISNATFYSVDPICVNIKNIKNVTFESSSSGTTYIARIEYGINCRISNVNAKNKLFCGLWLHRCVNSIVDKCTIVMTGTTAPNIQYSYGVSISECTNTTIKNCYLYNSYWHAATTTGASDGIFTCNTIFDNCVLLSSSIALAFLDHDNGFFTQIKNSVVQSACIGAGGSVVDSIIVAQSGSNHNCRLQFQCVALPGYKYTARNIQFIESVNTNILGFQCIVHGNDTGKTYYADIYIENVKNTQSTKQIAFGSSVSDGLLSLGDVVLKNVAVNIRAITANNLICENVGLHKNGDCSTIGTSTAECSINKCKIINSNFTSLYTNGRIYMVNCDSNLVNMRTINAQVYMENCRVSLAPTDVRNGSWQGVGLLFGGNTVARNIYFIDGVAYSYIPSATGYTVSQV